MPPKIHVATRKGLFTIERQATGAACPWKIASVAFLGDTLSMALPDQRDGTLYAAMRLGHFGCKLHRSLDGKSWEEVKVPEYPPKPEGLSEKDMWGKEIPWKLDMIWALEAGHASEPGALWCGTLPGGLFRSEDRGNSWALVESLWQHPQRKKWFGGGADLPGIHSICVHPKDAKHVAVGVSCGGVSITTDGGKTWGNRSKGMRAEYMPPEQAYDLEIQDPHRLVQCQSAPDYYWVQHHNGIFRTMDGSLNWTEIKDVDPAVAGFPVVVHPKEPNTAWFVPMVKDEKRFPPSGKVVVTRTRDGGKTFQQLRKGLPQEHAYDLVFRHSLDIDKTGDLLAFGSTTGSLWVTEDQGDSWMQVSSNLPPVYCVRME